METNDFYTEKENAKILAGSWPKLDEFFKFMDDVNTKFLAPIEPKKKMKRLIKDYCKLIGAYKFTIEKDYGYGFEYTLMGGVEYNLLEIIIIIRFKLPFEDGQENIHLVYESKEYAIEGLLNLIKSYENI